MAVKIRLSRIGRTKSPVYRIIAINERDRRDGAALEVLGTYDPLKGQFIQYHSDRIAHWAAQGAVETEAVKKLRRLAARTQGTTETTATV